MPAYNWWNEGLHGVARAGIATVFPQAIGLAATWNTDLIRRMAEVISDEGRAKHHEAVRNGDPRAVRRPDLLVAQHQHLPRSALGARPGDLRRRPLPDRAAGRGLHPRAAGRRPALPQDRRHRRSTSPCTAARRPSRHSFNAVVSQRDLRMTYLPAFQACISEGKAYSIMGAYNRVNGEACCASPTLLQKILREEWGFDGYVVSDCGAIDDIYSDHRLVESPRKPPRWPSRAAATWNAAAPTASPAITAV